MTPLFPIFWGTPAPPGNVTEPGITVPSGPGPHGMRMSLSRTPQELGNRSVPVSDPPGWGCPVQTPQELGDGSVPVLDLPETGVPRTRTPQEFRTGAAPVAVPLGWRCFAPRPLGSLRLGAAPLPNPFWALGSGSSPAPAATHPPPAACPAAARSGSGSLPRRHRRLPRRRPRPPRARPGPRPPTWPVRCLRDGEATANQRRASSAMAYQLRACWQVKGRCGERSAERSIQAGAIERRERGRGDIQGDIGGDAHGGIPGGFHGATGARRALREVPEAVRGLRELRSDPAA